jgi:RNA recognition motif-containing protein
MNIYVGNLSYEVTDADLKELFETYGQVSSSSVIKDKFSGQSKGFGFVEMPTDAEAKAAIGGLNGRDLKGRTISVDEARPRAGGGGGGTRGRSGGGGGGRMRY